MATLETIRAEVRNITGTFPMFTGDNEIGDNVVDQAIAQAVNSYSRDFPRIVVEAEVGDSGKYYPLSNLASWEDVVMKHPSSSQKIMVIGNIIEMRVHDTSFFPSTLQIQVLLYWLLILQGIQ